MCFSLRDNVRFLFLNPYNGHLYSSKYLSDVESMK